MTIEELRDKLKLMGATEPQLKSKILEKALFALGGEDVELYEYIESERTRIEEEKSDCKARENRNSFKAQELERKERELNKREERLNALYETNINAIEEKRKAFYAEIKDLETPEARDRVRLVNIFLIIADRVKLPFAQDNLDIVGEILTGVMGEDDKI